MGNALLFGGTLGLRLLLWGAPALSRLSETLRRARLWKERPKRLSRACWAHWAHVTSQRSAAPEPGRRQRAVRGAWGRPDLVPRFISHLGRRRGPCRIHIHGLHSSKAPGHGAGWL